MGKLRKGEVEEKMNVIYREKVNESLWKRKGEGKIPRREGEQSKTIQKGDGKKVRLGFRKPNL